MMGKSAWIFRHPVSSTLGPALECGSRQPVSIFVNPTNEKVDGWFVSESKCSYDWRVDRPGNNTEERRSTFVIIVTFQIGEDSLGGT
jgi:hypothetical protein